MILVVQDWLFTQLGVNFNLYNLADNNPFQDGCILADILQKYGLLDSNYRNILKTSCDPMQCRQNLQLIKPVLDMLKVTINADVILGIVENKPTVVLKLLYELYVCLENKQHLYFITQQNFENIQNNIIKCLDLKDVEKVTSAPLRSENCLEQPLIKNRDIIQWYREKQEQVKLNLQERMRKLKVNATSTVHSITKHDEKQCSLCSYTEELILPPLDKFPKCDDNQNLLTHEQFIAWHKLKEQKKGEIMDHENSIHVNLLQETWSKIMERQNEIYNSVFSEIMLKQSQYEKQILTKLIRTQEQLKVQSENKIKLNKTLITEEEKQINCDFKLREEFEQLKNIYNDENKRVEELHKKLFKEKQDIIKKRHYSLCNEIMSSLIDIACTASEYVSKYEEPVPKKLWNNWKEMFYKSQPVHIPLQKLESEALHDGEVDYDEVIAFEKDISDILNESDVNEYLFTCGRWFYKDVCMEDKFNENALAFIVYRLLFLKYPLPPSPVPANLPPFKVAGVLLDVNSLGYIEKLKSLLSKPRILIFDTDTAIKTSISTFQKETATPSEKTKGKQKLKSKGKKQSKTEGKIRKSKSLTKQQKTKDKNKTKTKNIKSKTQQELLIDSEDEKKINLSDKETQTSVIKEVDERAIDRTPLGLIGQEVYNILSSGEKVGDTLLVSVIIEYLKTFEDIDGWVLLNYPQTLTQASLVELALTGKHLPIQQYIAEENESTQEIENDEWAQKRMSKLLSPPVSKSDKSSFKTYFTCFIKAKEFLTKNHNEFTTQSPNTYNKEFGDHVLQNEHELESRDSLDIQKTDYLLMDVLEVFYKEQSVFREFFYDTLNLAALKNLARMILNEDRIGAVCSAELFGEEILSKLTGKKKEKKKKRSSPDKKKKKSERKGKSKEGKEKVSKVLSQADMKELEKEESNNETETKKSRLSVDQDLQMKEINPGDDDWENISVPIDSSLGNMLATWWENIENCYLDNLRDICFENRLVNLMLVPYTTYVRGEVGKIRKKPDLKKQLVTMFQNYYISIEEDLRALPDVKTYLHCRVFEMQKSLWKIADERKQETERKRHDLIHDNWLANELCILINGYLSLVQTEFDRSLETAKLVCDYYQIMLGKSPMAVTGTQPTNIWVSKLTVENLLSLNNEAASVTSETKSHRSTTQKHKYKTEPYMQTFNSLAGLSESLPSQNNFIAESLINCYEVEEVIGHLTAFLSNETEQIINRYKAMNQVFLIQIKAETDLVTSAKKKTAISVKKDLSPKAVTEKSKRKNSPTKKLSEVDLREEYSKIDMLLKEWAYVLDMEVNRLVCRISLISKRATEDIIEFFCYLESAFCDLYNLTLNKYNADISNINKLCSYLNTAIEEESPLLHEIIFNQDEFVVDDSQDVRKIKEDTVIKELYEKSGKCSFTIDQLYELWKIFQIAGPDGVIRKQPFFYILQDLMVVNAENNKPHFPELWTLLSTSQLRGVIDAIFGPEHTIDWRDFIIYNLDIAYPTIEDILSLRKQFLMYDVEETEVILFENYSNVILWFEKELPSSPEEALRFAMIKRLLFKLFSVDKDNVNYTALLLYFCKDFDPKLGLRKALCLSLGKDVLTSKEEMMGMLRNEEEVQSNVMDLLTSIINSILINREGVLIYEIFDSVPEIKLSDTQVSTSYSVTETSDSTSLSKDNLSLNSSSGISEPQESNKAEESFFDCFGSSKPFEYPNRCWLSRIPVATVISILNASFLQEDKTNPFINQYLSCLEEEADDEGMIEAHILVNLSCMKKLFTLTNKFKISIPSDIIQQFLGLHY